jgi:hypothetical protein
VADVPAELGAEGVVMPLPSQFAVARGEEAALVEALRDGDHAAFGLLIDRYGTAMLRVARIYVATAEATEDVVQGT